MLERLVEVDLLGGHRLRLDDQASPGALDEFGDVAAGVFGRACQVDARADRLSLALERGDELRKLGDRRLLAPTKIGAQGGEVDVGERLGPSLAIAGERPLERLALGMVGERCVERALECFASCGHGSPSSPARTRPLACQV